MKKLKKKKQEDALWHIFIKMEQDMVAYNIVADFMETYEEIIRPHLETGKTEEIKFLILETLKRGEDMINQKAHLEENGAYAKYRIAIQYLSGILEKEDFTQGFLQKKILPSLDRQIADLDLILSQNHYYKSLRKKEQ